tara:strand:+ start:688 stop:1368 length:681 start_codon:yes stop_codon:yes gene_type:complete
MGFFDIFGKNTEKDMIYMALLNFVSNLDGDMCDKERLYASQFGLTLSKSRREKGAKALLETKLTYAQIIEKAALLSQDEKIDLIQQLINMANADGKIDSTEGKFLVSVSSLLGLNHEAMIKHLVDDFGLSMTDLDFNNSEKNSSDSSKKSDNSTEDNSIGFKKNRSSSVEKQDGQNLKKHDEPKQMSKDEAKKELVSLKEYLDLGIINQEEFDNKAVAYKKILLGN